MTGWEIFPFEREGLRVIPLEPPQLPEPDRKGEHGVDCWGCRAPKGLVWSDDHWLLCTLGDPGGAPLVLMLQPREHHDLVDLPDERAGEFGLLVVHVARAIEKLPHIARAHVSRWGDGGAHLHVFFFARPEGFSQLRGTCFAIWDDLLPQTPAAERDADAQAVATLLAQSYGGASE
jgi:diadenosine tetraphosphate (Ap4A) HIT family hydrolase